MLLYLNIQSIYLTLKSNERINIQVLFFKGKKDKSLKFDLLN